VLLLKKNYTVLSVSNDKSSFMVTDKLLFLILTYLYIKKSGNRETQAVSQLYSEEGTLLFRNLTKLGSSRYVK
jgi:hypothetical protein